jgi:uncharacterized protein YfaS (alpha-2-macroglobulin family)
MGGSPPGVWRWVGQSAAFFSPQTRLPFATELEVTVPAGIRAEDGSALASPYTFRFETDRPRLVSVEPREGPLATNGSFEVMYSQPVALEEVLRTTVLTMDKDGPASVPLRAGWAAGDSKTRVTLTPTGPLPPGVRLVLSFDGSLRGLEGPLASGRSERFETRTLGPLTLVAAERGSVRSGKRCGGASVGIELSNPVTVRELKAHTRFDPPARINWNHDDDDALTKIDLAAALSPAQKYELVMTAGMKDIYGQSLAHPVTRGLEVGHTPWLGIDDAEVFEAESPRGRAHAVTVESANLLAYDLVVQPLSEIGLARYLSEAGPSFDPLAVAHQHFPQTRTEVIHPSRSSGVEAHRVSLDAVLGSDRGRGAALVVAETEGPTGLGAELHAARLITRTDLGISARLGLRGGVVWVSHLSDGKPVAGATVAIREGKTGEVESARTDESGMATLPAEAYSPVGELGAFDPHAMIVARSGDDWTFRPVSDALELDCQEPELGRESLTGLVFTATGDYELGDTIEVKALFKDDRGSAGAPLAGRSVHLSVTGAQGNLVSAIDGKLDSYGGFATAVRIPAVERPGPWVLQADVLSPSEHASGSATARIRVVAPARTEAKIVITSDRRSYVRGESARFQMEARDALGAPIAGAPVVFSVRARPERFVLPGATDLVMDDDAFAGKSSAAGTRKVSGGTGTLNGDGQMTTTHLALAPAASSAERVTIEARASSSEGPVTGRESVLVHPADFYLGLVRPKERFVPTGATLHASALALDLGGGKREGVPIHFELLEKGRALASCQAVTTGGAASCDLVVSKSGALVLRASSADPSKNPVASSLLLYAPGPDAPLADGGQARVTLVSDRALYEVGETATVLIDSPFRDADAIVSVEGASAPRGERAHISGATRTFRVPIAPDMLPSAHVSVVLLKRPGSRGADGMEDVAPLGVGDLDLRVDPTSRRVAVRIAPSPRPVGDEFLEADVSVGDASGAPVRASVTFYAVERAGPRVPALYATFEAPPAPSAYWIESRADLGKPVFGESRAFEPLSTVEPTVDARDERPGRTVFFDGSLLTDVVGRVHVRFRVPEGLDSLRLVAVALGEGGRFGAGESVVDVSPPLGVVLEVPAVVRAGDAFTATAEVTLRAASGDVKALATLSTIGLEAVGAVTQEVSIRPGVRVVTSWPLVAPQAGKAEVVMRVRAGDLSSEARLERVVLAPLESETVVLYGESAQEAAEGLGPIGRVRPDEGGLDLKAASSPFVGLDEGIEQVLKFPYVDTEQHVTRLVALSGLSDLVRDYRVPIKDAGPWADREIAALLQVQLGDGSFGPWDGAPAAPGEAAWRSTYALWALNVASQHDHAVPSDATARALGFVRSVLLAWDRTPRDRAEAAFALDVLADLGLPDIEKMEALFQARAQLPLFARALLAHAMTVTQMDHGMVDDLLGDAESHLRSSPDGAIIADAVGPEYGVLLDSSTRGTAMLLRALVARAKARAPNIFKKLRPPELVSRLARGLLAARRGGTWRTPEETIWALLALEDYRATHVPNHPDVDAFFYLSDRELLKMPLHGKADWQQTASFDMRKVLGAHADGGTLGLRVKGDEKVYYEARLRFAPADVPVLGVDHGLALEKRVTRLPVESASLGAGIFQHGDRVLVDVLIVTATALDHVVVDDPVPGGLVVAPAAAEGMVGAYRVEIRPDRVVATFDRMPAGISHVRYVGVAKTPGRYVVPPTRAASLYEPERSGTTATSSFEVK